MVSPMKSLRCDKPWSIVRLSVRTFVMYTRCVLAIVSPRVRTCTCVRTRKEDFLRILWLILQLINRFRSYCVLRHCKFYDDSENACQRSLSGASLRERYVKMVRRTICVFLRIAARQYFSKSTLIRMKSIVGNCYRVTCAWNTLHRVGILFV